MNNIITLYHGSVYEVNSPNLHRGKRYNDYGQGFYCTEHLELACEWAAKTKGQNGYANQYELDITGLRILDLTKKKYSILNWMAILLQNRTFTLTTPISVEAKTYLIDHFGIDTSEYDLISGYRADDSYFSFANDFLNNTISVEHLAKAMRLGKLGIQKALVSEKAFAQLHFVKAIPVENQAYYPLYCSRDLEARRKYKESKEKGILASSGIYVLDILRGGIVSGDSRIS